MPVVTFSGLLYPQMRPPMKQASRFRSTARTSRPSLTSWDLVWPLVFKLLCHVSSNWYLMLSLLHNHLFPSTLTFCSASFCVCLQNPHSVHYFHVSEPGAKSDLLICLVHGMCNQGIESKQKHLMILASLSQTNGSILAHLY